MPTKIEDQALTVYHFWYVEGPEGHRFNLYLNGLFELLKETYPDEVNKALQDACDRMAREKDRQRA